MNVKVLTLENDSVPDALRQIAGAPKKLFYRGKDLNILLSKPLVAIVGSRKVDAYGQFVTKKLSADLASRGCVIVSGLALGVDAIAHSAAIETGGESIAVLTSRVEYPTPRSNASLGEKLVLNGGLFSERADDKSPFKQDFLARNRLISGLSKGVIITQAAARSGSLNTARHALEQGRVVMAVPGPITNPLCEGPNNLLKMGAVPVTCADDVLKAIGIYQENSAKKDYDLLAENESELLILRLLQTGITSGEELALKSRLSPQVFNTHLTMLEIRGVITPLGANHWTL